MTARCTITFLTAEGEFRTASVGEPLCAELRAAGAQVINFDLGHSPTPWSGPQVTATATDDLGHHNGWAYDPVEQAWTARTSDGHWLSVSGDLDDPPSWAPKEKQR